MQNAKGKPNATLATALLFAIVALTPLSFKALGVSPSLSAGVEAWRHIAGLLSDGRQPLFGPEILARNLENGLQNDGTSTEPLVVEGFDLAWSQPPALAPEGSRIVGAASMTVEGRPHRCGKAASRPAVQPQGAVAVAPRPLRIEVSLPAPIAGVALAQISPAIFPTVKAPAPKLSIAGSGCEKAIRRYQEEMEKHRSEFNQMWKLVPREVKVVTRMQSKAGVTMLPGISNSGFRSVFSLEKLKELRVAELRPFLFEDRSADSFGDRSDDLSEKADKGEL